MKNKVSNQTILVTLILCALSLSSQAMTRITSGVMKGHKEAKKIVADIKGVKKLYLAALDAGDGIGRDHAVWGNPVLVKADGTRVSLTTFTPSRVIVGWNKLVKNKYYDGKKLKIGHKEFDKGLLAHAQSVLTYNLKPRDHFVRFEAEVGVQAGGGGTVVFVVDQRNPLAKPDVVPNVAAMERAIKDLTQRFGAKYPNGTRYLAELKGLAKMPKSATKIKALLLLQKKALLANPLLSRFKKILAIKRKYGNRARSVVYTAMPSMNTYSLEAINPASGHDELVTVSDFTAKPKVSTIYKPKKGGIISEVDLGFDGKKLMYSGIGSENNWHLHEVSIEGKYMGQLTPKGVDYSSMDSCYLPDGRIMYTSTAPDQGLPCESGRVRMSNTFLLDPKTKNIQRLTFDQDSNWGPTMMEDGKIMYMRWEYSDLPHFFSRMIMTMNPDGTLQKMMYGSNGFWPNSYGRTKPIPGAPTQFVAVLGGHHSGRPGPMCVFDISKGRAEAKGAVQMIPGYGKKVKPIITDRLYAGYYPKFQNPIPLGKNPDDGAGTYFLVSAKPTKDSLWGIYLVDRFDNMVKIVEQEGYALNEPIPVKKTKRPPVIPDRINPKSKVGYAYIANIYEGPGLKNIPKGTVKKLRVFTYHYSFYKSGSHEVIGCESSWDVKRLLGTVPVNSDGSASFEIPANTPIVLQPLDETGAALQLMRSWFIARPGEYVSCIGCHENPNTAVNSQRTMASRQIPNKIEDLYGKERNFSYLREVQPIITKKCAGCHNPKSVSPASDGTKIPDFATLKLEKLVYQDNYRKRGDAGGGPFPVCYNNLNPYARRPGPESNYHLPDPMEYHANTSYLIQYLRKGHNGVKLTDKEWGILNMWIDLNVPCWGSYTDAHRRWANALNRRWSGSGQTNQDQLNNIKFYQKRRIKEQKLYANIDVDFEADQYSTEQAMKDLSKITPVFPTDIPAAQAPVSTEGWPFSAENAKALQGVNARMEVDVNGSKIAFRRIPAGAFVLGGGPDGDPNVVQIKKSFWMAEKEVINALYHQFDTQHSSAYMDTLGKDHSNPGIPANTPNLPVIRVSWNEAVAFTKWLSKKTGKKFRLPTEAEWEFAARAGTDTDFYWGTNKDNFGAFANLADKSIEKFNARQTFNYLLRIRNVNDKAQVQTTPGSYKPNAFGLYDMIGNVAEWTMSNNKPYPYDAADGRNDMSTTTEKISRGGSWRQIPRWVPVSRRVPYQPYQRVYNVGIRLVIEE